MATTHRLVRAPIFVISTGRSGTTLLRFVLGSHSSIHAPHELHLRDLKVDIASPNAKVPMDNLDLGPAQLEYLLWDALLHAELAKSDKPIIVDATPSNCMAWPRYVECWPDARFIFLLRHPARIAESLFTVQKRIRLETDDAVAEREGLNEFCAVPAERDEILRILLSRIEAVDQARAALPGHTVRYEDLTNSPVETTKALCDFIGVDWEPAMLDYGQAQRRPIRIGLGDWGEKICSGRIQASAPPPAQDEISDRLLPSCRAWGYLDE